MAMGTDLGNYEMTEEDALELSLNFSLTSNRTVDASIPRGGGQCLRCSNDPKTVKMPCGHSICPACLVNYAFSEVDGGCMSSLSCSNRDCQKEWSLGDISKFGGATKQEVLHLQSRMSKNALMYMWTCPSCGCPSQRRDKTSSVVRCPNCYSNGVRMASFCFHCKKPWIGSVSNEKCGNRECQSQEEVAELLECSDVRLGKGAYGVVYKGTLDGIEVAVKKIHKSGVAMYAEHNNNSVAKQIEDLLREGHLLKTLKHNHVVKCHAMVEKRGEVYMVMELMDCSLSNWFKLLRKNKPEMEEADAVNMSKQVADGLRYLHGHNPPIMHRDLSSNNILIKKDSCIVKLCDLGMAKYKPMSLQYLKTTAPGTLPYMPPEVFIDHPKYTEKLDVFSLGVLMMEIKTLITPKMDMVGIGTIDELKRREKYLHRIEHGRFKQIIISCLQNNHRDRPSAEDVYSRLNILT